MEHTRAIGLAKAKKARFLLASTSEVYGDPLVNPQQETYWGNVNPIGPRGVYDEAKRFAEAMTMAYRRYHGVDTRIVRIFNTYGPRMRPNDGRVVSNFIVQSLQNKPLTVYGDGMQTRSFCYVSDLISGIVALLSAPPSEHLNMPINIGNPEERTVRDLASKVLAMTDSKSTIEFRDLPVDDPHVRCPDISRAKTILGWKPEVGVDEGLRLTVDYFRKADSRMILVTGGAGYIGSHTVKALKAAGLDPVIFDNFSTGHRSFVKSTPAFEGDICNPADLDKAFRTS